MKILVVNCGSSSLKYQVLDMTDESLICKGLVERIGIEGSILTHSKIGADKFVLEVPMKDHKDAISHVIEAIQDKEHGVITDMSEIGAVGHRVAHGGEKFAESVLITDEVLAAIEDCVELAPLHNPANILGIKACMDLMPGTPEVAAFDTAFHQSMPAESYIYSIPYKYYEQYGLRRYGFHGTSHKYVAEVAADMLDKSIEDLKIITCHLGNGASIAAVKGGRSIDTSMGFTPLAGLAMGTRSGDIDPAIISYICKKEGITVDEMNSVLNKESGVYGMSGISSDMRDIKSAAAEGNERAQLTLDVYAHKIKAFIGAYIAEMNGVDAIVFTAGIGENDPVTRANVCRDMDALGIILDPEKNETREQSVISADDSKVKVLLIPTNEELMIARDTLAIASK
ncbi:MAG: acetate kinase [Anaerovoracaceae bacterium]|nr:acetate kinase [Bacillota bacterium]MDY5975230.1 acetate kinase [Anaerovoracaceae bacterium]